MDTLPPSSPGLGRRRASVERVAATRPTTRTRAIVLRGVDFGDSDRVVTLLTEEVGIVAVMARGVRKGSRRFPGAVPSFAILDAELAVGRGEVGRLAEAAPRRSFPALLGDLERMRAVGGQLDWLRRLLPSRQPDPDVFETTVQLLEAVAMAPPPDVKRLVVAFRARVASLLGIEPSLVRCARCGREPGPRQAARFDPASGGIVCRACGGGPLTLSGDARRGLIAAQGTDWTDAFPAAAGGVAEGGPDAVSDAEHVLGAFLDYHARR